jgi:enolase
VTNRAILEQGIAKGAANALLGSVCKAHSQSRAMPMVSMAR